MRNSPIISDDEITALSEEYGITINANDATQYKLCQVIMMLRQELEELKQQNEKPLQ